MPVVAVIGGQWGDEAKGKIIDVLAQEARAVVRFSGGSNAGHTVVNEYGEFRMHLVPSGIFAPRVLCVIANGVAVDPVVLLEEMEDLTSKGIDLSRLVISDLAHVVMPYHRLLDGLEERARGKGAIGTTGKGLGPCFADKTARLGIRLGELLEAEVFRERLGFVMEWKNRLLTQVFGVEPLSFDAVYQEYLRYGERLAPYVGETSSLLRRLAQEGAFVLLEGAQGTHLDPDFGTYPYVTSSPPTVAGACLGTGLPPTQIAGVIGVFKAYATRVGAGPFPTELPEEEGNLIRERAWEYGATTGRPRRCGWFDGVVARASAQLNGFSTVALTRLDVLDIFPTIKVCIAYQLGGQRVDTMPRTAALLREGAPVYEELPGWQEPTSGVRRYQDLPPAAQAYVRRLEELVGCPASIISVGPSRGETIRVRSIL